MAAPPKFAPIPMFHTFLEMADQMKQENKWLHGKLEKSSNLHLPINDVSSSEMII